MKCPNCGKEIADDSKFCEFCGQKIEQAICPEAEQLSLGKETPQSPNDKGVDALRKYTILMAIMIVIHLASIGVAYSVHWETFAYYGIDYEGYPGAGDYNGIFFTCVFLWLISLIFLPFNIHLYIKHRNQQIS